MITASVALQELLCRTALENQKLELMSEVSNLKLKLNAMEKDRLDFDDRFRDSEVCGIMPKALLVSSPSCPNTNTHSHTPQTNSHSCGLTPVWEMDDLY